MPRALPNPGKGYIVHEQLGKGRWKEVYRVVVRGEWHDMALARFIEEPKDEDLFGEIKAIRETPHPNVAQLYSAFRGEDGKIYLLEELLYRPLENLAPLTMVDEFYGIARDLCAGLASLHDRSRVHRDLKLDNCGIDHFGTAKIFDLGSVTSEGGMVKGTTLSRAPELFAKEAKCTRASDVWAMGAVLFALRTGGDYPFVTKQEAQKRPQVGSARARFDKMVREKASDPNSEDILQERIRLYFPNGSAKLVSEMLRFDPTKRPTAAQCAEGWRDHLGPWVPAATPQKVNEIDIAFHDTMGYLKAFLSGTTEMSPRQWERTTTAIDQLEKRLSADRSAKLTELRRKVAEMRQSVTA